MPAAKDAFAAYAQPDAGFPGRVLKGDLEHVDYIPSSHMRIWYNTQNDSYPLHHHNALEVIVCVEHPYEVRVGEQTHRLQEGDILFIAPHVLHELHPLGDGSRFIFLIDLDPLRDLQDFHLIRMLLTETWLINRTSMPALYPKIYEALIGMADAFFARQLLWESAIYASLLDILVTVCRQFLEDQAKVSELQYREDYGRLANLIRWLDEHYTEKITQEQAADLAGFSRFYFSRLFKQVIGSTFQDYLAHRRIAEAQALLSTDCPITDIAFRTGFTNVSSFNRSFKKYTSCSPSDYRSRYRREHE